MPSKPLTAAEVIAYLRTLAPETPVVTAVGYGDNKIQLFPPESVEELIRAQRAEDAQKGRSYDANNR